MPTNLGTIRTTAADLMLRLFVRSIHPELYVTCESREYVFERWNARLRLTDAGHVVEFRSGDQILTEIISTGTQPLPQKKRLIERRLAGFRDITHELEQGPRYRVSWVLESQSEEVFRNQHEELLVDSREADLFCIYEPSTRFGRQPLSLMRVEASTDSLLLHAYHTWPEERAIARVQTLIEFAD